MRSTHSTVEHGSPIPPVDFLPALPFLRLRITFRLLEDTWLPAYKGAVLRGGFGYAMKRSSCAASCWHEEAGCATNTTCAYRWIFETPHPPEITQFHDLRDVPRPFVIEPPLDERTRYAAGDPLEFGLVLIGRGIDHLPTFIASFEELGKLGLGQERARMRLERIEALEAWQPVGVPIYQHGRAVADSLPLPLLESAAVMQRAQSLPADLQITFRTPLRLKRSRARPGEGSSPRDVSMAQLKHYDEWIDDVDADTLGTIVRSITWRLKALATFHGAGPWTVDHRRIVDQLHGSAIVDKHLRWRELERRSTHTTQRDPMPLGGLVGSLVLRGVSMEVRAVLLAGSLIHVGKACVFGHGGYDLRPVIA